MLVSLRDVNFGFLASLKVVRTKRQMFLVVKVLFGVAHEERLKFKLYF